MIKNVKKSGGRISTRGIPWPEQLPEPASKDKIPCIIWKKTINAEKAADRFLSTAYSHIGLRIY
ncbi:hypothetical protein WCP94_000892 [Bilophila wadsworthia]